MISTQTFSDSFLLGGASYKLENGIEVRHPIADDILSLGIDCDKEYGLMLSYIAATVYEQKAHLWQMGIDYQQVDDYSIFCQMFLVYENIKSEHPEVVNPYSKALSFFLGGSEHRWVLTQDKGSWLILNLDKLKSPINEESFLKIRDFLRSINCWSNEDEPTPSSQAVKKAMIEFEIEKLKRKKDDEGFSIGQLIDCVSFGGNSVVPWGDVISMPIYRLHRAFKRTQKRIDHDILMAAHYAGTVKLKPGQLENIAWNSFIK